VVEATAPISTPTRIHPKRLLLRMGFPFSSGTRNVLGLFAFDVTLEERRGLNLFAYLTALSSSRMRWNNQATGDIEWRMTS
jgi:hypothetical protein